MFDFTCFDKHGNVLKAVTQWDINQEIYIKDSGLTIAPQFHFCNQGTKQALVVQSEIEDGVIKVAIPNQLMTEPYNMTVYVYVVQNNRGRTLETIQLPVRPRPMPESFEYQENIG